VEISEPRLRGGPEFDLIAELTARARADGSEPSARTRIGIGDDAAVTIPGGATATSVDMLVEGVHFRRETALPRSVGRKALAVALSDLAAMGAVAGEAYVALGVPGYVDQQSCLDLYGGVAELSREVGVAVLGGDVSAAPVLIVGMTVIGHAESPDDLVGRAGARPGQVLAVTGELGGAAAGLILLDRPELERSLDFSAAAALRRRQLEPPVRLAAGSALAAAGAAAMIDVSDGLGADAEQVSAASGVKASIELEGLPLQDGVAELAAAAGRDPFDLAAGSGEDYELLVALDPPRVPDAVAAVARAGTALTVIGEVGEGTGVELRGPDGGVRAPAGFQHFAER
jgi:thiamine-monophosphate kinase